MFLSAYNGREYAYVDVGITKPLSSRTAVPAKMGYGGKLAITATSTRQVFTLLLSVESSEA